MLKPLRKFTIKFLDLTGNHCNRYQYIFCISRPSYRFRQCVYAFPIAVFQFTEIFGGLFH